MINDLLEIINPEIIYLITNWGVIPFWLLLIFIPYHPITNFFAQSIIPLLLLAIAYAYLSFNLYLENNILSGFELYYGCLLYTSPSPRDKRQSRMPSSA